VSREDLQAWFGTELGLREFVRVVKPLTTKEELELFVRWASRREPHLREAEIEWIEGRAQVLVALLERWEPVGARGRVRSVLEQDEFKFRLTNGDRSDGPVLHPD
jgi:hypothetical protein